MRLERYPCLCGGTAKWATLSHMSDQLVCDTCDYKTKAYWDGQHYAHEDWQARNKPKPGDQLSLIFPPVR